jgi:hypothetical protein
MKNTIHVLISQAGEYDAGATELAERIVHDEADAETEFNEMVQACELFIEGQIKIIEANEAMRAYNESAYGRVGGGYFYTVVWLAFPKPAEPIESVAGVVSHFFCAEDLLEEELDGYVRGYESSGTRDEPVSLLLERYC